MTFPQPLRRVDFHSVSSDDGPVVLWNSTSHAESGKLVVNRLTFGGKRQLSTPMLFDTHSWVGFTSGFLLRMNT
jgi:hypothetical protein